jgi:hypothetical protein
MFVKDLIINENDTMSSSLDDEESESLRIQKIVMNRKDSLQRMGSLKIMNTISENIIQVKKVEAGTCCTYSLLADLYEFLWRID